MHTYCITLLEHSCQNIKIVLHLMVKHYIFFVCITLLVCFCCLNIEIVYQVMVLSYIYIVYMSLCILRL